MGCECVQECKCKFFVSKIFDNIHEHIIACFVESGFEKDKIFIGTEPRDTSLKTVQLNRKRIEYNYNPNNGQPQYYQRDKEWYIYITAHVYRCEVQDIDKFQCILGKDQTYTNDLCSKYNYNIVNVDYSNAYNIDRDNEIIIELYITL